MSIDMPPEMPPVLAKMDQLASLYNKRKSPFVSRTVGGLRVEVAGFPYLKRRQVIQLLEASRTPSDFIRALAKTYHLQGNLLVQVLYRQERDTVFVYVVQKTLSSLSGPESITGYFQDLTGEENLERSEFERYRLLANLKARRQGVNYSVTYSKADDDGVSIVFKPNQTFEVDRTKVNLNVGNQGNRFVGRYFAGAGVSHTFYNGVEAKFDYISGVVDWGEVDGGKYYDGAAFNLNYPSTFGLNSLDVLYSAYGREVTLSELAATNILGEEIPDFCFDPAQQVCSSPLTDNLQTMEEQKEKLNIDGVTTAIKLSNETVLYSQNRKRLTFSKSLEWIDDHIDSDERGVLLDERYAVGSLALNYINQPPSELEDVESFFKLQLKGGLSGDSGTFSSYPQDREDTVAIGKRTAEFLLAQPSMRIGFNLSSRARVDLDLSGQISDGVQLPQMQQYVLGGISQLRAYLPGALIGDTGGYGKLSLSGLLFQGNSLSITSSLFAEYGMARFEDSSGADGAATRALSDAGVRLLMKFGTAADLELITAHSISEKNISDEELELSEVDFFAKLRVHF